MCFIEPIHRPLHIFRHRLEERYPNDAATTDQHGLEGCVVQEHWFQRYVVIADELFHEADSQDAQVASRVAARLHEKRSLCVQVTYVLWSTEK